MPERINQLTDEQKAQFPVWVKKWVDNGLYTGEMDLDKFTENAKKCYAFAGVPFPKRVIVVQSPIVGALASSIAREIIKQHTKEKNDRAVDSAVGSAVDSAVGSAVYSAVYSAVCSAVNSAVDSAVYSAVRSAVYSAVDSAVRSAVYSAVCSAVNSAVYSAVYSAVCSAVNSAVYSDVRSAVDSAVCSAVNSAVDSAVRSAVDSAVRSAVNSDVDSAVRSAVNSAVDSAVDSAVYSAVDSAVGSAIKNMSWHYWLGGRMWSVWQAWATYYRDVCNWTPKGDILDRMACYEGCATSASYWWANTHFVMVCNNAAEIHTANNQLHYDKGMAIKYRDGWGLYFLHGIKVPAWAVETPAEKISAKKVIDEENVDVKRELIRKVGAERILKELKAKTIDTWIDLNTRCKYELKEMVMEGVNRKYLCYNHFSIEGLYYAEPVPPEITRACDGRAWRIHAIERNEISKYTQEEIQALMPEVAS